MDPCCLVSVQYQAPFELIGSLSHWSLCYQLLGVELVEQGLDIKRMTQEKLEVAALEGKGVGGGIGWPGSFLSSRFILWQQSDC